MICSDYFMFLVLLFRHHLLSYLLGDVHSKCKVDTRYTSLLLPPIPPMPIPTTCLHTYLTS